MLSLQSPPPLHNRKLINSSRARADLYIIIAHVYIVV